MKARLLDFGSIQVDGLRYEHDIVIDGGTVRQRKKKPSKPYRSEFGHTPLSAHEELPWRGSQLIIGTGAYGSLPITPDVNEEADRRGVTLIAVPRPLRVVVALSVEHSPARLQSAAGRVVTCIGRSLLLPYGRY